MGYWRPPPPSFFNPAPRPLSWHEENGVRIPDDEDVLLFGYGTPDNGNVIGMSGAAPLVAHIAGYHATNPGIARSFLKIEYSRGEEKRIKTDDEILANYQKLFEIRAPDDPERGGLGADFVTGDGTIVINYWDMADDHNVTRKRVLYAPKKGGVDMGVQAWDPKTGQWGDEGFDFERDFSTAIRPILDALNIVSTALVSIFATPAAGAAWSAAFGAGLHLSDEQRAGTLTTERALGEAFGGLVQFGVASGAGEMLASEASKLFSSGLYKAIGHVQKDVKDFADSIKKVVGQAGDLIPKLQGIPISHVLSGVIPPEILAHDPPNLPAPAATIAGTLAYEWVLSTAAFAALLAGDTGKFYSWRKLSAQPDAFDSNVAVLLATNDAEERSREFQARTFIQSREPQLTFRQALARAKQEAPSPVDAPKTWRQAAESLGLHPSLVTARGSASGVSSGAIVAVGGVAALVAALWWFRR